MAKEIDGKRYLMISLEDPEIKVNGFLMNFSAPAEVTDTREEPGTMEEPEIAEEPEASESSDN